MWQENQISCCTVGTVRYGTVKARANHTGHRLMVRMNGAVRSRSVPELSRVLGRAIAISKPLHCTIVSQKPLVPYRILGIIIASIPYRWPV